ncbi:MAG: family N-acetyltransferase [Frankiales bacterium]|nr:family N-acetyltransferase [Frankiales bacterium]
MSAGEVVRLGADDHEESWRLGALAFGGDLAAAAPPRADPPRADTWGVRDDRGVLVARAVLLDHEQWWGGRLVPSAGIGGVAVHPDARGGGTASRLLRHVVAEARARGQVVSSLFPTVPGLYRRLGWELVASLDETVVPTRAFADVGPSPLRVRTAGPADRAALEELHDAEGRTGGGALSRRGRLFPDGPVPVADVVAVAEDDGGRARGYVAYDRGRGYDASSELVVRELVSADPAATRALLAVLGRWHPVAPSTRWHGPSAPLARQLPTLVPAPDRSRPWMLRVLDPVGAVAARGWRADVDVALRLEDKGGAQTAWRLQADAGVGRLVEGDGTGPLLHERGLALLWSGAGTASVRSAGLLDGDLPGLDAALAGPPPVLRDYF